MSICHVHEKECKHLLATDDTDKTLGLVMVTVFKQTDRLRLPSAVNN